MTMAARFDTVRIALANLPPASSLADSVERVTQALAAASTRGAGVVCFPECYVPGYRGLGYEPPRVDQASLDEAWRSIAEAARDSHIGVVLGTERVVGGALRITALVIDETGASIGFQDKVQLDPSEEATYAAGTERAVFTLRSGLTFGVAICHEGWRYPETVRWAVRREASIVFHPHFHPAEPGAFVPASFADPRNTFHEKAMLCRAAENTCYFASVNYAVPGSSTTSAIVRPDGTVLAYQPYGQEGLLVADLDLTAASRLLASRCRSTP
jgi:predicted amidohydrolase